MTRKLSSLLAIILCLGAIMTGCTPPKAPNDDAGQGEVNTPVTSNTLPELVLTENDTIIVGKVGEREITLAEYIAYFKGIKMGMDGGDSSLWENNDDLKELFLTQVDNSIKLLYAIPLHAQSSSFVLTDDMNAAIDNAIAAQIANANAIDGTSYEKALADNFLTDAVYRNLVRNQCITELMSYSSYGVTKEDYLNYVKENYVRVKHILCSTSSLDDEQKASVKALADSLSQRAKNGEDFEALVSEYSEDGMDPNTGYYFTKGKMVKPFEDASYALAVGEVSDPVESQFGYHIIKKYEMEDEYLLASAELQNEVYSIISAQKYTQDIDALLKTLTFEKYENLDGYIASLWADDAAEVAPEVIG